MRNTFQYFILNAAGDYYTVLNDTVITTPVETPLIEDLMNWDEADLGISRNVKYGGIFFTITSPLSFAEDGLMIARYIAWGTNGIESVATLLVKRLDDYRQIYKQFYRGDLDFSQFHSERLFITIEVQESGLYDLIKAREGTPYEIVIPTSGPDAMPANMDSMLLQGDYVYSTLPRTENYTSTQLYGIQMVGVSQDGAYLFGEQRTQEYISMGSPLGPIWGVDSREHNNYCFKADQDAEIALQLYHEIQYDNPASNSTSFYLETRIYKCTSGGGTPSLIGNVYSDATTPMPPGTGAKRVLINKTTPYFNVQKDDRVYYVVYVSGPGSSGGAAYSNVLFFGQQRIDVISKFKLPGTVAPTMRLGKLWPALMSKLTGGRYSAKSSMLNQPALLLQDNAPYYTVATSGDGLRGIAQPKIKTTLNDFYASMQGIYGAGIGIEKDSQGNEVAVLEPMSYFFNNGSVTIDLGEIEMPFIDYNLEVIFNQLKIGSPAEEYDKLNGKFEYNNEFTFALPILRQKEGLELVTPYRTGMYGIEYIRAKLGDQKTTDASTDNKTFLLELSGDTVSFRPPWSQQAYTISAYKLARRQNNPGNSASGVFAPESAYNMSLTPKRNLLRNGQRLAVALHQQAGKTITFQTADKNADLISNLGSGNVIERADVPVSSLPAPPYLPITFQFDYPTPDGLAELIAANPYGRINFQVRNRRGELVPLGGFIDDVNIKPGTNRATNFKLLACPDCELWRLV